MPAVAATITSLLAPTTITGLAAGSYTFQLSAQTITLSTCRPVTITVNAAASVPADGGCGHDPTITLPLITVTLTACHRQLGGHDQYDQTSWTKTMGAATITSPSHSRRPSRAWQAGSYTFLAVGDRHNG